MAEKKQLENVLELLETATLVMPFVAGTVRIIRAALAAGRDTISLQELQDAWQGSLDTVDATGRKWLKDHGLELPPPKPSTT